MPLHALRLSSGASRCSWWYIFFIPSPLKGRVMTMLIVMSTWRWVSGGPWLLGVSKTGRRGG